MNPSNQNVQPQKGRKAGAKRLATVHADTRLQLLQLTAVMTTQSQNKLVLLCLIEGNRQPSYISVPYYSNDALVTVDDLRKGIFDRSCKGLAQTCDNLTLIKIDVDTASPEIYYPLLRPDDSGEELFPPTALNEIWREPPPARRIHIFVTFTSLPGELSGLHALRKAAHTLYYNVWGYELNSIFQAVPGWGDYMYMTEQKIDDLGLGCLDYDEKALLVRKEYENSYKDLENYKATSTRSGGAVVTGQPGIGKTCFLYYVLLRLLCEEKTVAFQANDHLLLFQNTGVQIILNGSDLNHAGESMPRGTWALTDSHEDHIHPCKAFVTASKRGLAWIVQTTSPSSNRWGEWRKYRSAYMYWMDVFTLDELSALGIILHLDLKCLHDNFRLWGPIARTCIDLADPRHLAHHNETVASAARDLTKKIDQFADLDSLMVSHQLISVRPDLRNGSRQNVTVDFATKHLLGFVSRAYAAQDRATRLSFYKMIRGHSWFGTSAGHFFETHVLLWIRHAPTQDSLPCTSAKAGSPSLHIPACGKHMQFFSNINELKVDENESRTCWVPASEKFPTWDAIILTDKFIITVQMTLASRHDAKKFEFERAYNSLPSEFVETRHWCHVFLTDKEDKADSLRCQTLTEIPRKMTIHVYSALINIEESNSLLTAERVEKLDDDRCRNELFEPWIQQSRAVLLQKRFARREEPVAFLTSAKMTYSLTCGLKTTAFHDLFAVSVMCFPRMRDRLRYRMRFGLTTIKCPNAIPTKSFLPTLQSMEPYEIPQGT